MTVRPYIEIARVDHWFKNVFALPGTILALEVQDELMAPALVFSICASYFGLCLTASSNYVINEYLELIHFCGRGWT